jgi:hypothetical protein
MKSGESPLYASSMSSRTIIGETRGRDQNGPISSLLGHANHVERVPTVRSMCGSNNVYCYLIINCVLKAIKLHSGDLTIFE